MVKNYFYRSLIVGGILVAANVSKAQHDPYFTHFRFNQQAYNPAAAGVKENYICITGLSHLQWRQFTDETPTTGTEILPGATNNKQVAPETHNLNVNTLLKFGSGGRNKVGVGLTVLADKIGFMKTTTFKGAVNYRIPIQGNFGYLAVGLEFGSTNFGYDKPNYVAIDPKDPHIPSAAGSETNLDLGAGLYYSQKKFLGIFQDFYIGVSYNHLNAANYSFTVLMMDGNTRAVDMNFVRYLHINTGADWQLANQNWKLEPAILLKYNPTIQLDLSMTALFSNTFRAGLAWRSTSDAISLLIGYQKNEFQVGYSYDITMSQIRKVSDGTHELYVRYCIPMKFATKPPTIPPLTPRFMGHGAY